MSVLKLSTPKIEGVHGIEKMTHTLFDMQSEVHYYLVSIIFEKVYI